MEETKKIGAFPGKFLPPHLGHVSQIKKSAEYCDELYVVVADNTENSKQLCKKAGIPYISPEQRIAWLKEHFKDNPKIKIVYMSEDHLSSFPAPMEEWSKEFKKVIGKKINVKFADKTYEQLNLKYFPECEFVCFDRTIINISGTKIRENIEKYFDYIIPEAQSFFKSIKLN